MIKKINNALIPEQLPFLRMKCVPIFGITDETKDFINTLAQTCVADKNCAGLAANQIWNDPIMPPPAIFIIKMEGGVIPFINPILEKEFKKEVKMAEQCMSVPGKKVPIRRPYHIYVRYMDGEGTQCEQHFYDMMTRLWMHEYDHIQGKLIIDYE